jgi:hypothetical protein
MNHDSRHQCLIYSGSPSQKLPLIAAIIEDKLNEGHRCLYLNSAPMVAGMRSTLAALGMDVEANVACGRLMFSSDPASPEGEFNIPFMLRNLEEFLDHALRDGYRGLWVSGDMTWEFGPTNDFSNLLEYELQLEKLFSKRPQLHGVCQYHQDTLPQDVMRQSLLAHQHVIISETLRQINPHYLSSSWPADETTVQKLDHMISELCRLQLP